jgi:gamma-glutamylcyclotransferase (GGCT)/AIG2-like uncharacterized protein YtfP
MGPRLADMRDDSTGLADRSEPGGRASNQMTECVFFYGTLLVEFGRVRGAGIDSLLTFVGRGSIRAALFDVGLYPAAVPADDSLLWGDVYRMDNQDTVLARLDEIEGNIADRPDASLYTRVETPVTLEDGRVEFAWVYFYNAPLGQAERIISGDYRQYISGRRYP